MKDRLAAIREIRSKYERGQEEKAAIDQKLEADRSRLAEIETELEAAERRGDVWEFKRLRDDIKELRDDVRLSAVEARAWRHPIDMDRAREVWDTYRTDAEAHLEDLWADMEPIRRAVYAKMLEIAEKYNEIYGVRELLLRAAGNWNPGRSFHDADRQLSFNELHYTILKAEEDYLRHTNTIAREELDRELAWIGNMCLTHQAQHAVDM